MRQLRPCFAILVSLLSSAAAFGGIYESLYRGLRIAATPSGAPVNTTGDGFRVNGARSGRVRYMPNEFGQGWRLEFDRTFGNDTSGRPEIFDFGNAELELSGRIASTSSFTRRFIPTANHALDLINLNYSVRGKTGGQDFELTGTLNMNESIEINPFGFYTVLLDVSNTNSSFISEGLAIDGDVDADFDLGPMTVRGNVFFDATLAVLESFGVDTRRLHDIFPASPIDLITDEIRESLEAQKAALGEKDISETFELMLSAVVADRGALRTAVPSGPDLCCATDVGTPRPAAAPEPASLLLLAFGAALLRRR